MDSGEKGGVVGGDIGTGGDTGSIGDDMEGESVGVDGGDDDGEKLLSGVVGVLRVFANSFANVLVELENERCLLPSTGD